MHSKNLQSHKGVGTRVSSWKRRETVVLVRSRSSTGRTPLVVFLDLAYIRFSIFYAAEDNSRTVVVVICGSKSQVVLWRKTLPRIRPSPPQPAAPAPLRPAVLRRPSPARGVSGFWVLRVQGSAASAEELWVTRASPYPFVSQNFPVGLRRDRVDIIQLRFNFFCPFGLLLTRLSCS